MPERTHRQPLEPQRRATPRVETAGRAAEIPAIDAGLTPELMLRLQSAAGNHAVGRLVAGKLGYGVPEDEEMPPSAGRLPARMKAPPLPAGAGEVEREETGPKPRLRLVTVAGPTGSGAEAASGGLGFKKVSGPKKVDCGGYKWIVQWVLDKKSPKGGWIVQGVTATFDVKDAAGKAVDVKKLTGGVIDPATQWTPYWEAWKVNAGKDVTKYAEKGDLEDDMYSMPGLYDTTKGSIKIEGKAEFYEDLTLPADFKVTNAAPAWILPMTRTKPTLAGGTGAIDHTLTAKWDCTAGSASKATTVTTSKAP